MGYLRTCARAHRASVSQKRLDRLCSNLVCELEVTKYVLSTSHGWGGTSLHVRTCTLIFRISGSEWPIVLKFDVWLETQKLRDLQESEVGWPHSHVRVQFRCLGNRWALALKPHQKQTYFFRAHSFIAKHGVLLVEVKCFGGRPKYPKFGTRHVPWPALTQYGNHAIQLLHPSGIHQRRPLVDQTCGSWDTGIFRIKVHICFPPSDANIENSSFASVPFEYQKNAILFVRRLTVTLVTWAQNTDDLRQIYVTS